MSKAATPINATAEGPGEAAGVRRDGGLGPAAGGAEALVQRAVVGPGGFESDTCDALAGQPVARVAAAALVVGAEAVRAGGSGMGVEKGLAGVGAGDCSGVGLL